MVVVVVVVVVNFSFKQVKQVFVRGVNIAKQQNKLQNSIYRILLIYRCNKYMLVNQSRTKINKNQWLRYESRWLRANQKKERERESKKICPT